MTKPNPNAKRKFAPNYTVLTVAWLKTLPPGTQVTTGQVAEAIGCEPGADVHNLRASLRGSRAIRSAHITGGKGGSGHAGGFTVLWSLAEHEPIPVPERMRVEAELLPARRDFPEIQPRPGPWFPGVYAQVPRASEAV